MPHEQAAPRMLSVEQRTLPLVRPECTVSEDASLASNRNLTLPAIVRVHREPTALEVFEWGKLSAAIITVALLLAGFAYADWRLKTSAKDAAVALGADQEPAPSIRTKLLSPDPAATEPPQGLSRRWRQGPAGPES